MRTHYHVNGQLSNHDFGRHSHGNRQDCKRNAARDRWLAPAAENYGHPAACRKLLIGPRLSRTLPVGGPRAQSMLSLVAR
jgi:hypothetical protein